MFQNARITAAIGPSIQQASYEVGAEFRARLLAADAGNDRFFAAGKRDGHCQFDLPGYVAARLARVGLGSVDRLARDTCAEPADFFSYRRNTLEGRKDYGRNISLIAVEI